MEYNGFFEKAMEDDATPYDYQAELAGDIWPHLLEVPTGMGKTAAIVLAWLYKRSNGDANTPRRLVYCLPMRVLVEQTRDVIRDWICRLDDCLPSPVDVHVLMGGESSVDWDLNPECDAILIGTQDMLISRVLNRGYGMSRFRWPMHFGLLNNDCMWVFDEVQLMGAGLATTAQLHGFRQELQTYGQVHSLWLSATLDREWLRTIDLDPGVLGEPLRLGDPDKQRSLTYMADKPLKKAQSSMGDAKALADEIKVKHQPGGRTLIVVNTVKRATDLYKQLEKLKPQGKLVLIHSRFRSAERQTKIDHLLAEPDEVGTIIISTQVVEAGVDVSARVLFTELAPWASLVQRFGRCNRRGEYTDSQLAEVFWIDYQEDEENCEKLALPYAPDELHKARNLLEQCKQGVGPESIDAIDAKLSFQHRSVIRRKDLIELFDTTPDLAGNDIDIDRYVRDADNSDVQVFWREVEDVQAQPMPNRDELCRAPLISFKEFAEKIGKNQLKAYRRNFLDRKWEPVSKGQIYPGQTYMLHAQAGGYDPQLGWTGKNLKNKLKAVPIVDPKKEKPPIIEPDDGLDQEPYSQIGVWQTLSEHSSEAQAELSSMLGNLVLPEELQRPLLTAIRWHDLGKAHTIFRQALPDGVPDPFDIYAKGDGKWKNYLRPYFRHELASALAVLQNKNDLIPDDQRDLIAYLVAAHHGKVRLSIRSMPNENHPPDPNVRFARGVWDGDELPETDLGDGVTMPKMTLSLEPMELGLSASGKSSWVERMLNLRDTLGPFRLAYLEALLRAADMRVSRRAARRIE